MSATPGAAWRVATKRAVSDKGILSAVFVSVLIAVMLIAAGPMYINSVALSSLRRTLVDAPPAAANVVVSTRVTPLSLDDADANVVAAMSDTFSGSGGNIFRRGTSDSFDFVGIPGDHSGEQTVFRWFTGLDDHAAISGSWPRERSDLVEVAIPDTLASRFGLNVGDSLATVSRRNPGLRIETTVSGIYDVIDPSDPYWLGDRLDATGIDVSSSSTRLGPLIATNPVFYGTIAPRTSAMRWSVFPDYDAFEIVDLSPIVSHLDNLGETLNSGRDISNQFQIETELASTIRETERSLLVTRSAVLIVTIQMAILAIYALALAANLLIDSREIETDTLRARGSSVSQLIWMATIEGMLLCIPALLVGPYLAALTLRMLNQAGPLAKIGLTIAPRPGPASWALAGVAAIFCIAVLVIPVSRAARRFGSVRADRARPATASMARRAGFDIALLIVAVIGLWQLARYGTPLTRTVQGQLGIDPLLVAAPALALVAGAVLALRALPMMARFGEVVVERSTHLVPALGVWHLGRQPGRFSRSALLLILALTVGVFAVSYDATWQRSQSDQAGFANGADLVVEPARLPGSLPDPVLGPSYRRLPGVKFETPVLRGSGEITGAKLPAEYVALDATTAGEVVIFRPDQASRPLSTLMASLGDRRPELYGIELPGTPDSVEVDAALEVVPLTDDQTEQTLPGRSDFAPDLRAVMLDSRGVPLRAEFGEIPQTGATVRMTADLEFRDASGQTFKPEYPLRLVGFESRAMAPLPPFPRVATLTVASFGVTDGAGSQQSVALGGLDAASPEVSRLREAAEFPEINPVSIDDSGLVVVLRSGMTTARFRQPVYYMVWLDRPPEVGAIPVLVGSGLSDDVDTQIGSTVPLPGLPLYNGPAEVVGEIESFPTVDPNTRYPVILDYPTYVAAVFGPGVFPPKPEEYWLSSAADELEEMAGALQSAPFDSVRVTTLSETLNGLALDPVSLGTIGSLLMGLAAATVLAAIGFLVNVMVTNRSRRSQFALMRAIGLSTGQILRWIGIENGVVVGFAATTGIVLGVVLSQIALPLTAITPEATGVAPPIEVIFPWPVIAGLIAALGLMLVGALVISRSMLGHLQPATVLRAGDE